jgi:RHS repeat-associated protein
LDGFIGHVEAAVTQGELYYVHNDHIGTPLVMSDESGIQVWRAVYGPFGKATVDATSNVELNVRFPGQYYDSETGLHYNYYRYYDVDIGRYLTSDPIGLAGGVNTYGYVGSNPIRWTDYYGLDAPGCDGVPNFLESNCMLNMCSKHDYCYFVNRCTAASWANPLSQCSLKCNLPAIGGTLCAFGSAIVGRECDLEPDLTPRAQYTTKIPEAPMKAYQLDNWEWEYE